MKTRTMMASRRELSASFAKRGMKQNEFFTTCDVRLPISSGEIDRALILNAYGPVLQSVRKWVHIR